MPFADLPVAQARQHRTSVPEPADLDSFWQRTLCDAKRFDLAPTFEPAQTPYVVVDTYDCSFVGANNDRVRAWLHLPTTRAASSPLPCVVEFIGYGGGRGEPHEHTFWACAGFAHLVMDVRGQGSSWSTGETADPNDGDPAHPGVATRGLLDKERYYYRRLFTDAVRAIDVAKVHPAVDADRVVAFGGSQGGALALAVAALRADVFAVLADVPFLCDIRRAVTLTDQSAYAEIARYLKVHRGSIDQVFDTLAYFDVALLASRATAPCHFSVALSDTMCPPSTVFAAYNAYDGPKVMTEYEFNDHEAGGSYHQIVQAAWLRHLMCVATPGHP